MAMEQNPGLLLSQQASRGLLQAVCRHARCRSQVVRKDRPSELQSEMLVFGQSRYGFPKLQSLVSGLYQYCLLRPHGAESDLPNHYMGAVSHKVRSILCVRTALVN
jgi:hypothetical protein